MATWLIVLISTYCGISYGIALMMLLVDHTKFSIRLVLEFIFFPIVILWFFGEEFVHMLKNNW